MDSNPENIDNNNIINNNDKKDDKNMIIKIQTLDNTFTLTIPTIYTVLQLKEKISEKYKIPKNNQRLIFQGKLMKDNEKLSFYKITDDCVIHLVAKALEENNPQNNINNNNNINSSSNNNNNNNSNQNNNNNQMEEIFPIIQIPFRSNLRRRRLIMPHYDMSECFEALYQNILAIDNLTNCKKPYSKNDNNYIECFDFNKSQFHIGQWVDAKDTIDQWLEAQVIQVKDNKAFIHYNGWGVRWDEWMDFNSPKIRNFKINTLQSPVSAYMSPYPGIPCDSNVEPQPRSIDSFFYLEKLKDYLEKLLKDICYLLDLRKKNINKEFFVSREMNECDKEILFNSTQIIPFMDRIGRMLCDISLQFSHLVVNPTFYPSILMGYKREDIFKGLNNKNDNSNKNNNENSSSEVSQTLESFPIKKDTKIVMNNNTITNNNNNNNKNIENKNNNIQTNSNKNNNNNQINHNKNIENKNNNNQTNNNKNNINQINHNKNNEINEDIKSKEKINDKKTIDKNKTQSSQTQTNSTSNSQINKNNNEKTSNNIINNNNSINISENSNNNTNNNQNHQNLNLSSVPTLTHSLSQSSNSFPNTQSYQRRNSANPPNNTINNINRNNRNNNRRNNHQNPTHILTNLGYILSSSSEELPFIQRIISSYTISDRIVSPHSNIMQFIMNRKFFPRVNLQISSLLSPGEVMMMTGFTPNNEPNFDIYVHTIVSNPRRNSNNNNQLVVSGFSADYHNHQLIFEENINNTNNNNNTITNNNNTNNNNTNNNSNNNNTNNSNNNNTGQTQLNNNNK